jgi:hypothetical protein
LITSSKLVADKAIYALRGFRSIDNQVYTYLQERAGFSYFYPKRKVLADGVSTPNTIFDHPYKRPNTVIQFQLFNKYKYIQQ